MIHVHEWIELAAQGVEALAVTLMVCFILIGTLSLFLHSLRGIEVAYRSYRIVLGKTLLVGLELLVAADVINTVAFALTLTNLALLAGLVMVRTALGWILTVEMEGRWPWQQSKESRGGSANEAPQSTSQQACQDKSAIIAKGNYKYARHAEQIR